jgi:TPR repeat protein
LFSAAVVASCRYGQYLLSGRGVKDDPAAAVAYFQAAQCKNVSVWLRNDAQAVEFFRRAADRGNSEGDFRYAKVSLAGAGVRRGVPLALSLLQAGAAGGHAVAQLAVVLMREHGIGAPIGICGAARLSERVALSLRVLLSHRRRRSRLPPSSFPWRTRATRPVGVCGASPWRRGLDFPGTRTRPFSTIAVPREKGWSATLLSGEWTWCRAQRPNSIPAQRNLGMWSMLRIDLESAWSVAAVVGGAGSSRPGGIMGFCLETGRGIKRDAFLAADYYRKDAENGHPEAAANYRRCKRYLGEWVFADMNLPRCHSGRMNRPTKQILPNGFCNCYCRSFIQGVQ